jgi:thiazole synthase
MTVAEMLEKIDEPLELAGRKFRSRLILGTGKYKDNETMVKAIEASGTEIVTVAVRRVDLDRTKEEGVLYHLDPDRWALLPNTAGCYTADDSVRYARTLVADGFKVLAYTNEDLITALKLEEAGVAAVMPLASPIGSGLGLLNPFNVRLITSRLGVPVIVDAGVGTASDACMTMEQGVDGILMNTAVAAAKDPVRMALAMRYATESGRLAYLAGRMPKREQATPSSPTAGMLD